MALKEIIKQMLYTHEESRDADAVADKLPLAVYSLPSIPSSVKYELTNKWPVCSRRAAWDEGHSCEESCKKPEYLL